jgi:hypothetical protein
MSLRELFSVRELWVVWTILAIGAIAVPLYIVVTSEDEPAPASAATTSPTIEATPTPDVTPSPAASAATPTEEPASLYEPFTWDDPKRVQRLPPPTEADALAERDIYRDGFAFPEEPAAFAGVPGGDECEALVAGTPLRAGDWIVSIADATSGPRMELLPRTERPEGSEQLALPWIVRWLYLDDGPARTHVHEQFWGGLDGVFAFPLVLPEPGTWRAVATYGPNWGCFTLEVTDATPIPWRTAAAEALGADYPAAAPSAAEVERFDELLAQSRALGTAARQCVDAGTALWVRSGELTSRLEQIQAAWSPTRRSSKVGFGVLGQDELGELLVLGAASPFNTYGYLEPGPVESATSEGEPLGTFGYVTSINPPSAGEWLLTAEAGGDNWGCFRVRVG